MRRWAVSGMMDEELGGSQIGQGLVGADVIVGVLPGPLRHAERGEIQLARIQFVEFFGVGAVGPFDGAIEFGGPRGQDEEPNAALLAGLLKSRLNSRTHP